MLAVHCPESNVVVNDPPQKESAEHRKTEFLGSPKACHLRWSVTLYFVSGFEVADRGISTLRDIVYVFAVIA